jgi:hypothetical protein
MLIDLRAAEIMVAALRVEHRQACEHLANAESAGRAAMLPLLVAQCDDLEARLVLWESGSGEAAPPEE